MGTRAHTLKITLTGGATYDKLVVPARLAKLAFGSSDNAALNYKFVEAEDPVDLKTDEAFDSGWLPDIWDEAEIYVNGTGDIWVEYWI